MFHKVTQKSKKNTDSYFDKRCSLIRTQQPNFSEEEGEKRSDRYITVSGVQSFPYNCHRTACVLTLFMQNDSP